MKSIASTFALICLVTSSSLFALSAEARNCTKGKPCGNSCISQKDVCHIKGGDSATNAPKETKKEAAQEPAGNTSAATASSTDQAKKPKDCKKGKPCGNGCISAKATCHAN
jgi:hypothetical protein